MLESGVELDRVVRAAAHAELTVKAASQIVLVAHEHFFLLALLVLDRLGNDPDRIVRTVHLANAAGHAAMLVAVVVLHYELSAEPVEHFQRVAVLGILLGRLLPEKDPQRRPHSDQQRAESRKKGSDILLKSVHVLFLYSIKHRKSKNGTRKRRLRPSAAGSAG